MGRIQRMSKEKEIINVTEIADNILEMKLIATQRRYRLKNEKRK